MGNPYPMLTYPGDLLRDGETPVAGLLGWDESFRPYEVIDVVVHHESTPAADPRQDDESHCDVCDSATTHSHVYMQYAKPETMKAQAEPYMAAMRARGLL